MAKSVLLWTFIPGRSNGHIHLGTAYMKAAPKQRL